MEYGLTSGKREINEAMKAGSARHLQLEEEVATKVKVSAETSEDVWALKFMNFITAANQLTSENLTRELLLIGFFEGVPLVGKVDEIRMPAGEVNGIPILVDTKTRVRHSLPSEAQKRKGRLQLMCYKYLWDDLVADKFPYKTFFEFFSLEPYCKLSEDIREKTINKDFGSETLLDVVNCFRRTCRNLRPANNQMLLRYELQKDNSLLCNDQFAYDPIWFNSQIKGCLEFWLGNREASYVAEEESWKCRYCQFASVCPANRMWSTQRTWLAPPLHWLKWNVDGSALGKPGAAGIGGVLRDLSGNFLCMFSCNIGITNSNVAELKAIEKALMLSSVREETEKTKIIIESDSTNAISWVKFESVPWALRQTCNNISMLRKKFSEVKFVHVHRGANSVADNLAKQGNSRVIELVAWL